MYRVICRFVSAIRYTPSGGQFNGSWRVVACRDVTNQSAAVLKPVLLIEVGSPTAVDAQAHKLLVLSSCTRKQPNSWCNPRKILAEWLAARRIVRKHLEACRRWDDKYGRCEEHAVLGCDRCGDIRFGVTTTEFARWRAA